jgi:hypothetical protein
MRLRGYWATGLLGYWATGLLGGRPPQAGVATEQSVLAWQLYYVDVCYISYQNKPPKA